MAASAQARAAGNGRRGSPVGPARRGQVDRAPLDISLSDAMLRSPKTSEVVARDLVRDIVGQGLQTGDPLPHEASMLEHYGVSRESLREGLRLLEVQGLISIRRGPGGGPTVGRVDPAHLGRIATLYYHLAGATYAELFDAWVRTEPILAEEAARNPDREAVRGAMAPYRDHLDPTAHGDDVEEFVQRHTHFHAVLASLTGNRVLELMLQTVGCIVTHHVVVSADPRDMSGTIAEDHASIARAVAAGHPQQARTLMEQHIRTMSDFYSAELGEQQREYIEWR